MANTFHGIPSEWKRPQRRASCRYCGSQQWTKDGNMPVDHDRPDGRRCQKFSLVYDNGMLIRLTPTATTPIRPEKEIRS